MDTELQEKLKKIEVTKSISDQLTTLSDFDNLTTEEKNELTEYHKSPEVGILVEYLGFEKLKNQLLLFLDFLQDANWPATEGVSKMLVKSEKLIIPHVKSTFKKSDDIWNYWIVILLIGNWKKEIIQPIKPDLISLIKIVDQEGTSIEILRVLKDKKLLTSEEFEQYYKFILKTIQNGTYEIKESLLKDLKEI